MSAGQRDNATTPTSADSPPDDSHPAADRGRVPRSDDQFDLDDMDLLPYNMERELHWSRMRGRHLRRGGTVRWYRDGTFVLEPIGPGVKRGVTRTGDP